MNYNLKYIARNDFFDAPWHMMRRKKPQLDLEQTLEEVVVKATKIKMLYKGDTVVFNADAYNIPEGSMLNTLIKQLPGVELKDNGTILVNGKKIDFMTLNGKDFFKRKNKMMLDNLPHYTVKNIKVYNKSTEKSEWLGIENAPKDYVMDVNLKKEYSIGYVANAEIAGGTKDRYLGKFFGLRYTDNSRLSFFANLNNTNESRSPGEQGDWDPTKQTGIGTTEIKTIGANLLIDEKSKLWQEKAEIQVLWLNQDQESRTSAEQFLSTNNTFTRQVFHQNNKDFQIAANNIFTLKRPFWLYQNVEGSYRKTNVKSTNSYAKFTEDPSKYGSPIQVLDSLMKQTKDAELMKSVVNLSQSMQNANYQTYKLRYGFNFGKKLAWGDDIEIEGGVSYVDAKNETAKKRISNTHKVKLTIVTFILMKTIRKKNIITTSQPIIQYTA